MIFRVVDIETTGTDPVSDRIVEVAKVDLVDGIVRAPMAMLVDPERPIPAEASAVHHITDRDVRGAPTIGVVAPSLLPPDSSIEAYVAHNAAFEASFLGDHVDRPWLCTWKCALRVWPDFAAHNNQALKYLLGLHDEIGEAGFPPHRALPDCIVTAHILREMLKLVTVEDLIAWSAEPPLFKKVTFGMHRGALWSDLPSDYVSWIIEKSELDEDTKWNARHELRRRAAAIKAGYMMLALAAPRMMYSVENLVEWFRNKAENRHKYGIAKGDPEYDQIAAACAARKSELLKNIPTNLGDAA